MYGIYRKLILLWGGLHVVEISRIVCGSYMLLVLYEGLIGFILSLSKNCISTISFFINCCVHCCGLQMSHVSLSFPLLSWSVRIVSSQTSLFDRRPMFVLVSLFLVCLPFFLLLSSAEYHNVLMCFSLCSCFLYTNFLQNINISKNIWFKSVKFKPYPSSCMKCRPNVPNESWKTIQHD